MLCLRNHLDDFHNAAIKNDIQTINKYVKEYCISNLIEEKNIRKTLLWIVLELSVVSYFLNN